MPRHLLIRSALAAGAVLHGCAAAVPGPPARPAAAGASPDAGYVLADSGTWRSGYHIEGVGTWSGGYFLAGSGTWRNGYHLEGVGTWSGEYFLPGAGTWTGTP